VKYYARRPLKWLGLAMMEIHQEIISNIGNVTDKFSVGNTRLKLNISACTKTNLASNNNNFTLHSHNTQDMRKNFLG
jgi:hypothetical protein